jgi:choline dehydrogenase-like flavoprotein
MFVDARSIAKGKVVQCDICIVGSGAAGITLANEFNTSGFDVVLLESGDVKPNRATQSLYEGDVLDTVHHGALDRFRQRQLGGTTGVWGGRCAPLDAVDFAARPHVPFSGWPIAKETMDTFYARAHAYCDLGSYDYDAKTATSPPYHPMLPGFDSSAVAIDQLWRYSLPTNFSYKYGPVLKSSPQVQVFLNANALKLQTNKEGGRIQAISVASLDKNTFTVQARAYVLAAGGLEVTRLLLVSRDRYKTGIGNHSDLLGRFYMSHMTGNATEVRLTPQGGGVIWDYETTREGVYCKRMFSILRDEQARRSLLNFSAILTHPDPINPIHGNGILSAMYLAKNLFSKRIPPEYSRDLADPSQRYRKLGAHLKNLMLDTPSLMRFSWIWLSKRILATRKLPSVSLDNKSNTYTLHYDAEQCPNFDSRVMLSDKKDPFGLNRLKVDWRYTALDLESVYQSIELLRQELTRSGTGRIVYDPESLKDSIRRKPTGVGSHHIGTTRMSKEPVAGVVDEHCSVHGIDNLFVASSSVFPTSGVANPTLTIVALAIRLADHLKKISK